jgi:adenylosuccinate lyase
MIPRYACPQMSTVWEEKTRLRIWFEIEAHACDALAEIEIILKQAAKAIWEEIGSKAWNVHSGPVR